LLCFCEVFFIKNILVGNTISAKCEDALNSFGYNVVKLPRFNKLQEYVSNHADMLIFYDGERIITHNGYFEENKTLFASLGIEIVLSDERMEKAYPFDILFNAVLTKEGILFSKSEYTSELIKRRAKKIIEVKQGYTACSTCRVSDNAFITTDSGLYKAYLQCGIDSILVSKDDIVLPGYDCGFIGGASVVIGDLVCFFGDIKKYRDYGIIYDFVRKHDKDIFSLSDEKLTDVGGAVVV